jgi:tRNA 2-thiouridine synthesizing protein A
MTMTADIIADAELDCVGLYCPVPIAQTRKKIDEIDAGQILKVTADDPAAEEDIPRWAKRTGHEILRFEKDGLQLTFYIQKKK